MMLNFYIDTLKVDKRIEMWLIYFNIIGKLLQLTEQEAKPNITRDFAKVPAIGKKSLRGFEQSVFQYFQSFFRKKRN